MDIRKCINLAEATNKMSQYLHDECWAFAIALHLKTGWQLAWISDPQSEWPMPVHGFVIHPTGRYVDASGFCTLKTFASRYKLRRPAIKEVTEMQMGRLGGVTDDELEKATRFMSTLFTPPFPL